jgi:two-component system, chemotaxis family, CheB/CheR fusion protein
VRETNPTSSGEEGAAARAQGQAEGDDAIREANERLLRSALREQEWAEELELRVGRRTADLARTNEALIAEIGRRERAEQARRKVLRQLVTAEENERRRISRELHDQMSQQVTGLLLSLRAVRQAAESEALAERVAELERMTAGIARDLQHLALELRPPALDTLGLVAALENHLGEWSERYGIAHDFHAAGLEGVRLSPELETTLYRVVQEGLTNVLKHAGATRVSVVLERRAGRVSAILEDDGAGFDVEETLASTAKSQRLGLRGMSERVLLVGGEFEVESSPGSGTTLFARIPDVTPPPAP